MQQANIISRMHNEARASRHQSGAPHASHDASAKAVGSMSAMRRCMMEKIGFV
jgi:hypothetical protein